MAVTGSIRIYNSSKQMIPLNICPPKGDFYYHTQNIYLAPGKSTRLPRSYINEDQVKNLQQNRYLKITHIEGE